MQSLTFPPSSASTDDIRPALPLTQGSLSLRFAAHFPRQEDPVHMLNLRHILLVSSCLDFAGLQYLLTIIVHS